MKISSFLKKIGLISFALFSCHGWAISISDKVIYGADDRILFSDLTPEIELDKKVLELGKSVFAQIPNWRVQEFRKNDFVVDTKDIGSGLKLCDSDKYEHLPIVSSCTAFLVSQDTIMTAGHCVKNKYDCKGQSWVLDYDNSLDFIYPAGTITFQNDKTYLCKELLEHSTTVKSDYALIRLDRPIFDRPILKIRRSGKVLNHEILFTIGHPLGMPKTLTGNIKIRDNSQPSFFKTDADTFSGNSGSPVFGENSGLVEGLLVRGEDDFTENSSPACKKLLKCANGECRGESIQRTTILPFKTIPK